MSMHPRFRLFVMSVLALSVLLVTGEAAQPDHYYNCFAIHPGNVSIKPGERLMMTAWLGNGCAETKQKHAAWSASGGVLQTHQRGYSATFWSDTLGNYNVSALIPQWPAAGASISVAPYNILYKFLGGSDGANPYGGLIIDQSQQLYGTTDAGGYSTGTCFGGSCGTVFRLTAAASGDAETQLYVFKGGSDGANPRAGLTAGANGALFGTTFYGGSQLSDGTVFELTPYRAGYVKQTIWRFQGGHDGANPAADMIIDKNGALYGTTEGGGAACNCGTVFKLTPKGRSYTEDVLYRFQGGQDGATPEAGLLADTNGDLYGTTFDGGGNNSNCTTGCGIVYRLVPSGSGYVERILYRFQGGSKDGEHPKSTLIFSNDGGVIGTTFTGGLGYHYVCPPTGCGVVFKLLYGAETILHKFLGVADGGEPAAGVVMDPSGTLYGTTYASGNSHEGIFFALNPSQQYQESFHYSFNSVHDGGQPRASLLLLSKNAIYGTTSAGSYPYGTVYEMSLGV